VSQENVEIARRAHTAASRRPKPDFVTVNALYHPDHELVSLVRFRHGGLRGARGFREWLTDMDEAYGPSREMRVDEARALDEERVLLAVVIGVQGRYSGAPVEQRMGIVMTLRDGRVMRTETYPSVEEALKAVGLAE
jgi:ketosteroid isomerase-like protein